MKTSSKNKFIKKTTILFFILIVTSCFNEDRNVELLNSDSKYIQKHAADPVNWHVWSDDIWEEAEKDNKLVLISIGYFACHWCHVMQNESFKNPETADIMNKFYYNVKIDKEQYPDVDIYFSNLQRKLTGWAGWPMHFILKPDKTVVWTGIYMKPNKWREHLRFIAKNIEQNPDYVFFKNYNYFHPEKKNNVDLLNSFDSIYGGLKPTHYKRKYPIPFFLSDILREYKTSGNKKAEKFLKLTAEKMYLGGINDQTEGGFFRFSIDEKWHIPHFEKMLYTNAGLISFYSEMYQVFKMEKYKQYAKKTANFLFMKMSSETPLFVGSTDADQFSEGSYYVYSLNEIKKAFNPDFILFSDYYNISPENVWQDSSYHLFVSDDDKIFVEKKNIPLKIFIKKKEQIIKKLKKIREGKQKPEKGTKLITPWNALAISSLVKIYNITKDSLYLNRAENMVSYFERKYEKDKKIKHYYLQNKTSKSGSFYEDNLFLANALIELYKTDRHKKHMKFASELYIDFKRKILTKKLLNKEAKTFPSIFYMQNIVSRELNYFYETDKYN